MSNKLQIRIIELEIPKPTKQTITLIALNTSYAVNQPMAFLPMKQSQWQYKNVLIKAVELLIQMHIKKGAKPFETIKFFYLEGNPDERVVKMQITSNNIMPLFCEVMIYV